MTEFVIKVFSYMRRHRIMGILSFVMMTTMLVVSVARLNYKEDIEAAVKK